MMVLIILQGNFFFLSFFLYFFFFQKNNIIYYFILLLSSTGHQSSFDDNNNGVADIFSEGITADLLNRQMMSSGGYHGRIQDEDTMSVRSQDETARYLNIILYKIIVIFFLFF